MPRIRQFPCVHLPSTRFRGMMALSDCAVASSLDMTKRVVSDYHFHPPAESSRCSWRDSSSCAVCRGASKKSAPSPVLGRLWAKAQKKLLQLFLPQVQAQCSWCLWFDQMGTSKNSWLWAVAFSQPSEARLREYQEAQEHLVEALAVLPFAEECQYLSFWCQTKLLFVYYAPI